MFTTESKLLIGSGIVAELAAAVAGAAGAGQLVAVLLVGAGAAAIFLGLLAVGAPVPADAALVAAATGPAPGSTTAPVARSPWPLAVALAVTVAAAGLVVDLPTAVVAGGLAVAAAAGWLASVVRAHSAETRSSALVSAERVAAPTAVPLVAIVAVGVVVLSVSRILLAVSKEAATGIAIAVAASILVGCVVAASVRRVPGSVLATALGAALAAIVVLGVVSASAGERTIEAHPPAAATVVAQGIAFEQTSLTIHTEGRVVLHFVNRDAFPIIHNVAVYQDERALPPPVYFGPAVAGVGTRTYTFDVRPGRTYFYRCEFHPQQMTGTLTVEPLDREGR
jgi:plastocyanin